MVKFYPLTQNLPAIYHPRVAISHSLELPGCTRSCCPPRGIGAAMRLRKHHLGPGWGWDEPSLTARTATQKPVEAVEPSSVGEKNFNKCLYWLVLKIHISYIYIYRLLIKIPLSRNGHSSRIKILLSRNFSELHVYLSRGPCWPTTPLLKIRSPPAKLRQRITDHFLVAF